MRIKLFESEKPAELIKLMDDFLEKLKDVIEVDIKQVHSIDGISFIGRIQYNEKNMIIKLEDESLKLEGNKARLEFLIVEGLSIDGTSHKQYFIEEIAKELGIDPEELVVYTEGIAP